MLLGLHSPKIRILPGFTKKTNGEVIKVQNPEDNAMASIQYEFFSFNLREKLTKSD